MKIRAIGFAFLLALLAVSIGAQEITVRNGHAMNYDSRFTRILLFGGADEKKVYGDLWYLDTGVWKLLKEVGPEPRTFPGFVYNEKSRLSVLFGGSSALFGSKENPPKFYNDTWVFGSNSWRMLQPANSPPGRAQFAMAYDAKNDRVVLFGGYRYENGKTVRLGDTWELKDEQWREIKGPGPSPRVGAAMAYDTVNGRLVLFGGATANKAYGEGTGETWVLNGDKWEEVSTPKPANIFDSNLVYQIDKQRFFRYGGWSGEARVDESWSFSNSWKKVKTKKKNTPPARNHSAMVYDHNTKRTILFGGHNGDMVFGDLWIWRKGRWFLVNKQKPIRRVKNGH